MLGGGGGEGERGSEEDGAATQTVRVHSQPEPTLISYRPMLHASGEARAGKRLT